MSILFNNVFIAFSFLLWYNNIYRYNILDIFTIKSKSRLEIKSQLLLLAKSEARVILLYSSKEEAQEIFYVANTLQLTGKNYIWIVTQSVVGTASESYAPGHFPTGMLGQYTCMILAYSTYYIYVNAFNRTTRKKDLKRDILARAN